MEVFEAISDPVRREILTALAHDGTLGAGEIAGRFAISRPAVSRHLRVLRESGVVRDEMSGRRRLYRLAPEGLEPVRVWVAEVSSAASDQEGTDSPPLADAAWSGRFDALDTEVRRARRDRIIGTAERGPTAAPPESTIATESTTPSQSTTPTGAKESA